MSRWVKFWVSFWMKASNTLISCDAVYCALNCRGPNFQDCGWNSRTKKFGESRFLVLFIIKYGAFLSFESVDEFFKCDRSNESCWAVLFCDVDKGSNNFGVRESNKVLNESYWVRNLYKNQIVHLMIWNNTEKLTRMASFKMWS